MVHRHLHKRQDHRHGDDPFSSIENGFSSFTHAAATFFGGGDGAASTAAASSTSDGNSPKVSGPGPVIHSTSTSSDGDGDASSTSGNRRTSTVYVTGTWTGTGTEFSLSTQSIPSTSQAPPPSPSTTESVTSSVPPQTTPIQTTSTTFHKTHKTSSLQSSSSLSAAATTSSSAITTTAAAATTALSSVLSISSSATDASQAAATTSSAAVGVSQNTGLSGGAKAGIAIGVVLGVLALIAGAFALYRMKRNRDEAAFEHENSSEKNPFSDTAAVNLGPVRAVSPNVQSSAPVNSNPFATGATQMASNPHSNGFNDGGMAAAGGLAGAAIGATAASMTRANAPPPLNVNRAQSPALIPPPPVVPSPVGSSFSESSTLTAGGMAAVGGSGAGGPAGPRMHRVQMDFNPTMEDELRIVAGEIVRIVREFDDGWCSVEIVQRDGQGNIMRHQQGVVPRTCLSRLPLKPRQRRPGPPGAGPSAPPMNNLTHPMGAQGPGRMQSPAFASNPVGRSMSPGPYGGGPQDRPQRHDTRSRSNSANDISFRSRVAGPGPSRMNPASQNPRPVELPIQSQSFSALPTPAFPGHNRNESAGSTASAPVARKPVPGQFDA